MCTPAYIQTQTQCTCARTHTCTYKHTHTHTAHHWAHNEGVAGVLLFNAYWRLKPLLPNSCPKQFDFQIDMTGLPVPISLSRELSPNS